MIFDWSEGILHWSAWSMVMMALILTHITILSTTIYLHRFSAHRSIDLHPVIQHFFRFWLWLTTGINTREWTAIHRKHHAVCESKDDPHSPVVYGLNRVLWGGVWLYRKESKNKETMEQYGKGCPNDWMERRLYTPCPSLGIALMLMINLLLMGWPGVIVWVVQMLWIPFWAAGVVNGIGHIFGYRNFECRDNARNFFPFGILIGGEELHNNHHAYPNSARLSSKKWEIDLGWIWICILQSLRLAKVRFEKPLVTCGKKRDIDTNTVMAIMNGRFHVMANYAKEVLCPLVHKERDRASKDEKVFLHKAAKLLIRDETILKPSHHDRIHQIVKRFKQIDLVYKKRIDLQNIWQKKGHDQRIKALKQWCIDAESSGIQLLQDFAHKLKCYQLPSA